MENSKPGLDRRGFLAGATAGAVGLVTPLPAAAAGAQEAQPAAKPAAGTAPLPSAKAMAAETEPVSMEGEVLTADNPGADFMVDVIKTLGFEYIAANPGSSFRALHESLINYGGNKSPEFITCCHEESSIAIADGYHRVEGRMMAVMAHGTVGLQHASMNIYNAFAGRVPLFLILGNTIDATTRRPGVEWVHSVQDAAAMIRDFIKWDDLPISLQHFAESAVRAYKIAMTVPMAPVVLVADSDLQEAPIADRSRLRIPKLTLTKPPAADSGAIAEVARLLVAAESPVIVAGRMARTPDGMKLLVELAETLQAPVQGGGRSFPSQHPLNTSNGTRTADVILGLQVDDFWGTVHEVLDQQERVTRSTVKANAKLISISSWDLYTKSNYQDFQRYPELDIAIAADAEASLPALIEACKKLITPERQALFADRGKKIGAASEQAMARARAEATYGWDGSPCSTSRVWAEMWEAVRTKDWALVSGGGTRLWNFDKFYQTIGGGGASAVGSGLPTAVGAALAHKKHGRLCIGLQNDGDLMYAPGALWTAAHHRIPMLLVMHNNRAYHQEVMHIQRMANRHQRGITNAGIGTKIEDPNIDFSMLAKSLGWYSEGPISNPKDIGPAIQRAVARVEKGEPALVDVLTQPR